MLVVSKTQREVMLVQFVLADTFFCILQVYKPNQLRSRFHHVTGEQKITAPSPIGANVIGQQIFSFIDSNAQDEDDILDFEDENWDEFQATEQAKLAWEHEIQDVESISLIN